jgi:hypothetical protein
MRRSFPWRQERLPIWWTSIAGNGPGNVRCPTIGASGKMNHDIFDGPSITGAITRPRLCFETRKKILKTSRLGNDRFN